MADKRTGTMTGQKALPEPRHVHFWFVSREPFWKGGTVYAKCFDCHQKVDASMIEALMREGEMLVSLRQYQADCIDAAHGEAIMDNEAIARGEAFSV
jgi:hypothetical protein